MVLVPAATADTAQPQILRHYGFDRRQLEDLMPNRLAGLGEHFTSALWALRLGPAQDLLIHLIAGQHRPEAALVSWLCAHAAAALGLGRTRATARSIARWRLGGGTRVQLDLLFEHLQPLPQLLH